MRIPSATVLVGTRVDNVHVHAAGAAESPAAPGHEAVLRLMHLQEREAERQRRGAVMDAVNARLQAEIGRVEGQVAQNLDQVASLVVELGLTLAREVVGGAVDRGLVDPTPIVRRCLDQCVRGAAPGGADLHVRMNPEDLQTWVAAAGSGADRVQVDVGPELGPGEVVVTTGAGQLHYDPREVFERLAEGVRAEAFEPVQPLGAGQAMDLRGVGRGDTP